VYAALTRWGGAPIIESVTEEREGCIQSKYPALRKALIKKAQPWNARRMNPCTALDRRGEAIRKCIRLLRGGEEGGSGLAARGK